MGPYMNCGPLPPLRTAHYALRIISEEMHFHRLSKLFAQIFKKFLRWFFYVVREADVFGRYDVTERKDAGFFINHAGDQAVGFCQKVEGLGLAGRVVCFTNVGNLLQVFIVPLDCIEMVEGHARGENIHIRETFVIHCLFNDVYQVLAIDGVRLGNESSTGSDSHGRCIKGSHGVAIWGSLGNEALGGSRRCLAFGKPINLVVEYQVGDIHISLHGMHRMTEADGIGVTVAGAYDHVSVFVGTFDALSKRKSSAVGGMSAVAVLVTADTGRATDAGNQSDAFIWPAFFGTNRTDGVLNAVVAASRAPVRYNSIFIVAW